MDLYEADVVDDFKDEFEELASLLGWTYSDRLLCYWHNGRKVFAKVDPKLFSPAGEWTQEDVDYLKQVTKFCLIAPPHSDIRVADECEYDDEDDTAVSGRHIIWTNSGLSWSVVIVKDLTAFCDAPCYDRPETVYLPSRTAAVDLVRLVSVRLSGMVYDLQDLHRKTAHFVPWPLKTIREMQMDIPSEFKSSIQAARTDEDLLALSVGRDDFSSLSKAHLAEYLPKGDQATIRSAFRQQLDIQARVMRWVLRGLSVELAIRKVQLDMQMYTPWRANALPHNSTSE